MQDSVLAFHKKYGHLINEKPTLDIPFEVRKLRVDLIDEEIKETIKAVNEQDLVEIADGIADSIYVLVGTAISYGIPIDRIFREVHRSNMTKTAVKAEDGAKYGTKTPKGPNYIAPDIHKILFHPEMCTLLESLNS